MQAAQEAATSFKPNHTEAQAHLQESLDIQSSVILQVNFIMLHIGMLHVVAVTCHNTAPLLTSQAALLCVCK